LNAIPKMEPIMVSSAGDAVYPSNDGVDSGPNSDWETSAGRVAIVLCPQEQRREWHRYSVVCGTIMGKSVT
jgi:hypothetical protein